MRFVPIKSVKQQAGLSLHRTRDLLVRQRTQLINMIRGLFDPPPFLWTRRLRCPALLGLLRRTVPEG